MNVRSTAKRATSALGMLLALAGLACLPSPAAAGPADSDPDLPSGVSERELERDRLLDPTFDVLAALPGFQDGGPHPDRDVIVVYWYGEVGFEARVAIAASEHRGVPVEVISVPYSYDELRVIAGQLIDALAAEGTTVDGHRLGDPFDEIVIWGRDLTGTTENRQAARSVAAQVLPPGLTVIFEETSSEVIAL